MAEPSPGQHLTDILSCRGADYSRTLINHQGKFYTLASVTDKGAYPVFLLLIRENRDFSELCNATEGETIAYGCMYNLEEHVLKVVDVDEFNRVIGAVNEVIMNLLDGVNVHSG
jgi:hypothetical protein